MTTVRLVSVSQDAAPGRFSVTARYVVTDADDTLTGEPLTRWMSGQQLTTILAVSLGEPNGEMVAALAEHLHAGGVPDDGSHEQAAREYLKAAFTPAAAAWKSRTAPEVIPVVQHHPPSRRPAR